jgi:hypothetical protein
VNDDPLYRLPRTADLVMAAVLATILPWGIKAVWIRLLPLDGGPEGAYISDESLGESLGLDPGTAKNYRFELRRLGLARTFPRAGTRQYGWVLQLPDAARPREGQSREAVRPRAPALARRLEGWLLERHPELAPAATRGLPQPQSPDGRSHRASSASSIRERGVGGRTPSSVVQSEAPLPPAVTSKESGVGAKAPTARKEHKDLRESDQQLGMPEIELRMGVIEGAGRSTDPEIRAAMAELDQRLEGTA